MTRSDLLKQGYTVEQITVYPMVPKPQAPIMRQVTRHDLAESLKTAALHRENAHAATPSAYSDCQLAAARAELRFAHSCVIFLRYNSIRLLRDEASEAQAVGREELLEA